ncbi:sensor histidine kinase [Chryseobacterium sp. R2A-55]|uniref:ATP-binding protein n=1 Tax=Chryseobacterium sp. R2A-55 TaxID=2744445 RepID=UPI001F21FC94|nr:sensor histidine kinase [Chryseobacterium sp. R2A-55]
MNTDSIKNLIKISKTDTAKIPLYFLLTSDYVQNDTDSSAYFLAEGKKLIDRSKSHKYDYEYYFTGIKIYHATQKFDKALNFNLKALETAKKNKNDFQKAEALRTLFVIYLNLKKDTLALQTAQKAIKLSENIKDTANLSIGYGNLSRLYFEIGLFKKSILYGRKSIDAGKRYHNLKGLLIGLNNTAVSEQELGNYKEAEKLFLEVLQLAEKNNIPRSKVKSLVNLINLNVFTANPPQLNFYLEKLHRFLDENPNAPFAKSDLRNLPYYEASNFLYQNKYEEAENTALKGISKVKDDHEIVQNLYNVISKINFAKRDYKKAQKYKLKSDSVQNIIDKENLSDFETELSKKYETQKKDSQIKLQESKIKNKNIFNYILLGSAFALLTILLLTYRNYSQRKKLQQQRISELETEKQLLASQSLLKGQEDERNRLAKDLHDGLGGLLSGVKLQLGAMKGNLILSEENANVFDKALLKLDESISEMRRVSHNLMPESLMKSGLKQAILDYCESLIMNQNLKINCELHGIDEKMDQTTEVIIYRIIQELLNNVVKHSEANLILVQIFRHENHKISITVEDNGKGFNLENMNLKNSAGIRNIKSRVEYLKGKLDIKSVPGKGTSVFIECEEQNYG